MSDAGLTNNDIAYETHVKDGQQSEPEQPDSEQPEQPRPELVRAPMSWLRQAAAEIEATKSGNPNPGRTRQSTDGLHLPSARHTMSESATVKLQQKDFTPEVDEILPQATSLAQVRPLASRYRSRLDRHCFTLGWPAPGCTGETFCSREASEKRVFLLSFKIPFKSNRI